MVDLSFGPKPGRRLHPADGSEAYLILLRRRRLYSSLVVTLVLALLVAGFPLTETRNAGSFLNGLQHLFDFPAEILSEAWAQKMAFGLLPQVAPNWLSYALLRFEINLRASAILDFVGQGGIGYDLKIALQWGQGRYDQVVAVFLLLFLSIVLLDRTSDALRRRLTEGA